MAKSRHFRLKSTFSSALILCNAVCSMTPGLSWSRDGKTTYDDLTQSTERMSPAKRKHPLLESWTEESRKKGSSVLSDIDKFLASDNHKQHSEDHLAPSTLFQDLQGHNTQTAQRDFRRTQDDYDPKGVREPSAQAEMEMVTEMADALLKWDEKQQNFVEELGRSPPEWLTHDLKPSNQEAGKNPQGLLTKRIQEKGQFLDLVAKENKAESKRADALKDAVSGERNKVESYLDDDVLEYHLNALLPVLPAGKQIFMMEINEIPVVQLLVRAIQTASSLRKRIAKTFRAKRNSKDDGSSGQQGDPETVIQVQVYLAEEFVEYSRLLLSILGQASRSYQWDLSDVSQLVPRTWFASILSDEKSVISHRITALGKLHLGDIQAAKKHFLEATKMQAAIDELNRSLHAIGLTTWNLEKDSKYLKLRHELNHLQEKWYLPPINNIPDQLDELATYRIALEKYWKSQADRELSDLEKFLEQTTKKEINWETVKYNVYDTKKYLEEEINKQISWQTEQLKELLGPVFEAFGCEIKARAEFSRGHPFKSHRYYIMAYQQQRQAIQKSDFWRLNNFLHVDWAGGPEYVKLKSVEKQLTYKKATTSFD